MLIAFCHTGSSGSAVVTALVIKEAELQSIFGEEARRKVTVIPSCFVNGREFDSLRRLDGRRSSAVRAVRRNRNIIISKSRSTYTAVQ